MRILRPLVYSNLFVAIVLSLLTSASYVRLNLDWEWPVIVSVFLGSYVLYSFHRLYKIDFIPVDQRGERHSWILNRANIIKITMSLSVFVAMLLLPNFDVDEIIWLVPAGIASLGYTIPFIPTEKRWLRLRDVPLTKPLIIALVVTYITLCFPIFVNEKIEAIFLPKNLTLFFGRFLFLLAVTIPFEIRDSITDNKAGLKTLATELGLKNAKRIAISSLTGWLIIWAIQYIESRDHWLLTAGIIVFILASIAIVKIDKALSELQYVMIFEGLIVLYSLGIIFTGLI